MNHDLALKIKTKGSRKSRYGSLVIALGCWFCLLSALSGCASAPPQDIKKQEAEQAASDQTAAQANLQRMLDQKAEREARQQQLAEQRAAEEAARAAEAAKPHYPPAVEASASRPRTWGAVNIEGMGIECHFNSNWTNGNLNYRVALLGSQQALEQFLLHRKYHINFQDQGGTNIFEYVIQPGDFTWCTPGTNGGIPTLETRGQVPCDLSVYLPAVQWNLTWVD